ncbi:MAG: hypothetical protein ACR2N3_12945 [Pyrinomonadaceae bacterium]
MPEQNFIVIQTFYPFLRRAENFLQAAKILVGKFRFFIFGFVV